MQNTKTLSEERENDESHELDLTDHHENISSGIKNIKKLYQFTLPEARKAVEASYIDRISKIPRILESFQQQLSTLKFYLISMPKSKNLSKFCFNLLKCCCVDGPGWSCIEGFEKNLTLSSKFPGAEVKENKVSELSYLIFSDKDKEICSFKVNLFERLAKVPVDQISLCKTLSFFENFKNFDVDFCVFVTVELSNKDKIQVLKTKGRGIQKKIDKLRVDAVGINIQKEFKSGCCECFIN